MRFLLLTLLGLSALGCGEAVDEAGADALWRELQESDYRSFERAPGYDAARPTIRAHGDTALVFINPVVVAALAGEAIEAWPEGSLLAKDSYSGGKLRLVAAMKKNQDGWFFAEWSGSGEVKYAGSPSVCTNCHSAGGDNVLALGLPEGSP